MTYTFYERDSKTALAKPFAKAIVNGGKVRWAGDMFQAKKIIKELPTFKVKFNEFNLSHWKLLPKALSGSRVWVVEVK